ncbi:hypothetical protein P0G10_13900 [Eubacteriales bacterium DFI.9.88]|nr:hypothetical protein [Eubacteriales bacterium DFI.9.88]
MEVMQGDQVLGVPNTWETAIGALIAGSYQVGCISQLMWNHPGSDEHDHAHSHHGEGTCSYSGCD